MLGDKHTNKNSALWLSRKSDFVIRYRFRHQREVWACNPSSNEPPPSRMGKVKPVPHPASVVFGRAQQQHAAVENLTVFSDIVLHRLAVERPARNPAMSRKKKARRCASSTWTSSRTARGELPCFVQTTSTALLLRRTKLGCVSCAGAPLCPRRRSCHCV